MKRKLKLGTEEYTVVIVLINGCEYQVIYELKTEDKRNYKNKI